MFELLVWFLWHLLDGLELRRSDHELVRRNVLLHRILELWLALGCKWSILRDGLHRPSSVRSEFVLLIHFGLRICSCQSWNRLLLLLKLHGVIRELLSLATWLLHLRLALGLGLILHERHLHGWIWLTNGLQWRLVKGNFSHILDLSCKHHFSFLSNLLAATSKVFLQFFDTICIPKRIESVFTAWCRWWHVGDHCSLAVSCERIFEDLSQFTATEWGVFLI